MLLLLKGDLYNCQFGSTGLRGKQKRAENVSLRDIFNLVNKVCGEPRGTNETKSRVSMPQFDIPFSGSVTMS